MNSILRQANIRAHDVQNYLCSYDPTNTTAVSMWAKAAAKDLQPGTLIFILEPIATPFGLISFVRKEEEEHFRVSDFAVVVRLEDNKPMVVSINNNTYELRFLEALIEEKARKAVIDRKRFSYIGARPTALMPSALKDLDRLANSYAKGGSRRNYMADNANHYDEPAMALLTACGIHMQNPAGSKQLLDIGLICQSLYVPEGKQQDGNRTQLKSAFVPIENKDASVPNPSPANEKESEQGMNLLEQNTVPAQEATGFNLLQSWGGEKSSNFGGNPSLFTQITEDLSKGKKPSFSEGDNWLDITPKVEPKKTEIIEEQKELEISEPKLSETVPAIPDSTLSEAAVGEEDVYKHLSDAITDLLGPSPTQAAPSGPILPSEKLPKPAQTKTGKTGEGSRWPAARSFEKLPAFTNPLTPPSEPIPAEVKKTSEEKASLFETEGAVKDAGTFEPEVVNDVAKPLLEEPKESQELSSSLASEPESSNTSKSEEAAEETYSALEEFERQMSESKAPNLFEESVNFEIESSEQAAIFSAVEKLPEKLADFQEPKVVMNEMASLMNRLESQVSRAAKKLAIKATEIEQRLTTNLDGLLNTVGQEDKDAYASLVVRADSLAKQFETLFDSLKTELAEKSATSREKVRGNLVDNQKEIEVSERDLREILVEEFKQNQEDFRQLVDTNETELRKLVGQEIEVLHNRLQTIDQSLEETSGKLQAKLENYFAQFKSCVDDKVTVLSKAFDYQIEVLTNETQSQQGKNTEKLKASKEDFFDSLERLIKITEIALSRQIRAAQTEFFLPRLKERKQIIEAMMQEMIQTFAEHSFSQAKAQSEAAENSLVLARQQLKELVEERLAKLDTIGRNQQTGLEDIFKLAAEPLEQHTSAVLQLIKQAEQEVIECESMCKKLAEAYNLDSDPKLTMLRQDVYNKVDSLKAKLRGELESALDGNCLKLEDIAKHYNAKLGTKRAELVQQVRQTSEKGLQSIRQAIHDAYDTVQSQREKYME